METQGLPSGMLLQFPTCVADVLGEQRSTPFRTPGTPSQAWPGPEDGIYLHPGGVRRGSVEPQTPPPSVLLPRADSNNKTPDLPSGIVPEAYKTTLCRNWASRRNCLFAHNCAFAHGDAELRPQGSTPKQTRSPLRPELGPTDDVRRLHRADLYKTMLCSHFQKDSRCPYGETCNFAHGETNMRPLGIVNLATVALETAPPVAVMGYAILTTPSKPTPQGGVLPHHAVSSPALGFLKPLDSREYPIFTQCNTVFQPPVPVDKEALPIPSSVPMPTLEEWATPLGKDCMAAVGSEIANAFGHFTPRPLFGGDESGGMDAYSISPEMPTPGTPHVSHAPRNASYSPSLFVSNSLAGVTLHFRGSGAESSEPPIPARAPTSPPLRSRLGRRRTPRGAQDHKIA